MNATITSKSENIILNELEKAKIRKVLSNLKQDQDSDESHAHFEYFARKFSITKMFNGKYYPFELSPTGALFFGGNSSDFNNYDHSMKDSLRLEFDKNPNGFLEFCTQNNIKSETICYSGGSYGIGSIYYSDLNDAINVIISSIMQNQKVKNFLTKEEIDASKTPEQLQEEQINSIKSSITFWQANLLPESSNETIFSDKKNALGGKLSEENKKRILAYLNKPSLKGWREIYDILITPQATIWQMFVHLYDDVPMSGDKFKRSNIPKTAQLENILLKAVTVHNKDCHQRIKDLTSKLDHLQSGIQCTNSSKPALKIVKE